MKGLYNIQQIFSLFNSTDIQKISGRKVVFFQNFFLLGFSSFLIKLRITSLIYNINLIRIDFIKFDNISFCLVRNGYDTGSFTAAIKGFSFINHPVRQVIPFREPQEDKIVNSNN